MSFFDETKFALKFLSLMENVSSESIIFSPTCILTELSILYIGANGETANEIHEIIGQGLSRNEIIELLIERINHHKNDVESDDDCIVTFANKLFHSECCKIVSEFCEILQTKLHGEIQEIDFSSKHLVAKELNKFIQKSTKNQIANAINEKEIPDGIDLAIISSLHFIAPWKDNFDPRKPQTFYSYSERQIEMMSRVVVPLMNWNLVQGKEWDCLGIPYLNYKAWMYIVLPKKEFSLSELIKGMTNESFDTWTQRDKSIFQHQNKFYSRIPLINSSKNLKLKEILKAVGIKAVFDGCKCDLQHMITNSGRIGEIIHTTSIKVDENGTEASSAATGYRIPQNKESFQFIAERPFLYFITTTDKKYLQRENENTKPYNLLFNDFNKETVKELTPKVVQMLKLLDIFGEPFDTNEFLNFCKQNRDESFFLRMEFKPRQPGISYECIANFHKFMQNLMI